MFGLIIIILSLTKSICKMLIFLIISNLGLAVSSLIKQIVNFSMSNNLCNGKIQVFTIDSKTYPSTSTHHSLTHLITFIASP